MAHAQTTMWKGSASSSWRDATQWTAGTPNATTRTTISVGSPNRFDVLVPAPLAGDTASVDELTIQKGGRMMFADAPSSGVLIVHGFALSLNGGDLILGAGRIFFRSDVQINNGGMIDAGSGTIEFQGNVSANSGSSFVPGTSTVIFNGAGDQSVSGNLQFSDLIVETAGVLTFGGDISVTGSVFLSEQSTVIVESGSSFQVSGSISGSGKFINENALPVQMSSLVASVAEADIILNWRTATELNNAGFFVERRTVMGDGIVAPMFRRLGFVPGSGTSTSPRDYTFADRSLAAGRYVYRISPIDRDGTLQRSSEVEVALEVPSRSDLQANYPNPFNPSTVISFRVAEAGPIRLSVVDLAGREIALLLDDVRPAGSHSVSWNAAGNPSGTYYARMDLRGRTWVRPLLLLK